MKAQDLMVGDWIYHKITGENLQITEILSWGVKVNEYKDAVADSIDIKPIPLTPEILEKNGFVYNDMPFVQGWEQFGLTLYRGDNDGFLINCGENVAMKINAVHQLQNALRLAGIEKEITL